MFRYDMIRDDFAEISNTTFWVDEGPFQMFLSQCWYKLRNYHVNGNKLNTCNKVWQLR